MSFVNLHCHDEYSLLDGFGHSKDYIKRAEEIGQEYLAITNHGNVDGLIKFQKAASETNVQPIFGCEMYIVSDIAAKTKGEQRKHIILLVENQLGWENLLKMLTIANTDGFYYKPRIDSKILLSHLEGLIILTGCSATFLNEEWGLKLFKKLVKKIPDNLYLEIMPLDYEAQHNTNDLAIKLSEEYNIKLVATNDCHYILKEDEKIQEILLAIQSKAKWNDPKRWRFSVCGLYLKSEKEMVKTFKEHKRLRFKEYKKAMNNSNIIAKKCCNFKIEEVPVDLPEVPILKGKKDEVALRELCGKGFKERIEKFPEKMKKEEEYKYRLEEEFEIIVRQGFARYFLIVWELIKWCRENNIMVGPGRGSSGGSLICYLLYITGVDPIEFGLIFARFISPARIDLPDIDMDFEDIKRPLIRKHLEEVYGENNVVGVTTFSTLKGRGAVRDVSRVFNIPLTEVDKAAKSIVVRSGGDFRSDFSIEDAFNTFEDGIKFKKKYPEVSSAAMKVEGQVRGKGQHAAAMVISSDDLREGKRTNFARGKDKTFNSNWDKYDIEHFGLMKLDVLGLNALTVLNETRRLIKKHHDIDIDYESLSLDDKKCYEEFSKGNNTGCFQVGSLGLKRFCRQIGVDDFMMLVHATSLYRPGTLRCVTGDTRIKLWNSKEVRIDEIDVGRPIKSSTLPVGRKHRYIRNNIKAVKNTGVKNVYKLTTADGEFIKASKEHKFYVKKRRNSKYKKIKGKIYEEPAWVELKKIDIGDKILINNKHKSKKQFKHSKKLIISGENTRYKKGDTPWNKGLKKISDYFYNHYNQTPEKIQAYKEKWVESMFEAEKWNCAIEKMKNTKKKYWSDKNNRKKHSDIMIDYYSKNEHPNSKGINISKPQKRIFEEVKKIFNGCKLEYRFDYIDNSGRKRFYNLDAAIPDIKINIEFDGDYWHENPGRREEPRDTIIESEGWDIIRITYDNIEEFLCDILDFIENNSIKYAEVKEIELLGKEKVYDIMTKNQNFPNYIANDFIVHNSGMTTEFVKRKNGEVEWESPHPIIEKLTENTFGIILYQEQVMKFMYELGGLGWKTADTVRKVISKSQGVEQFQRFKEMFAEGCEKRGTLDKETARKLWEELSSFGSYGFNLSHAVEYSVISYWDMWCKVYYPEEFICASLTYGSDNKKEDLIEEAFRVGMDIRPPKVGKSESHNWVIKNGKLYTPFIEIKGFGDKTSKQAALIGKKTEKGFFTKNNEESKLTKRYINILEEILAFKDKSINDDFAETINYLFPFSYCKDPYRKFKGILNLLSSSVNFYNIKDINFNKIDKDYKHFFGQMTEIKFGYREAVKKLDKKKMESMRGTADSLGGVYGNYKDETDFCMLVFGSDIYMKKKEQVEHCSEEFLITKGNVPSRAGSIQCVDAWFQEDILKGELKGLKLELAEKRRFRNKELLNCKSCTLAEECNSPIMPSNGRYNIMVIGEAPGRDEERVGKGFIGRAGKLLWDNLENKGHTRRDFNVTNVVKCFPSTTKTPSKRHINQCSKWLDEEVKKIKPFLILALGNTNIKYWLGEDSGIMSKNGTTEWNEKANAWICWCVHPASVLHQIENKILFDEGIKNFTNKIKSLGGV